MRLQKRRTRRLTPRNVGARRVPFVVRRTTVSRERERRYSCGELPKSNPGMRSLRSSPPAARRARLGQIARRVTRRPESPRGRRWQGADDDRRGAEHVDDDDGPVGGRRIRHVSKWTTETAVLMEGIVGRRLRADRLATYTKGTASPCGRF